MLTDAAGVQTPCHDGGEPGQTDHGSLDGALTDPYENGSRTESVTLSSKGDSVTGSHTENADGTTTDSVKLSEQQTKLKVGAGTATMTLSEEVAVTHDPAAGTKTFTFTAAELAALEAATPGADKKDGSPFVVGAKGTLELKGSYSVTLPEGATIADALAVDPTDPSSLQKGSSIAMEDSLTTAFTGSGAITIRGVQFGASTTQTDSQGTVTQISRGTDGTYAMATGEKDFRGATHGVSIGIPNVAKLEAGGGSGKQTSVIEHAVFADSPAGVDAMRQAHATGTLPPDTSDAVLERYKDEHTASVESSYSKRSIGGDSGSGTHSMSHERISSESVVRTHSDGHQQGAERYFTPGGTSPYVEKRTETGEETLYVTATNEAALPRGNGNDPTQRDTWDEMYSLDQPAPATEPQATRIVYTESEVAQMRANENPVTPSDNELHYMLNRSYEDPNRAAEEMYRNYNDLEPGDPVPQDLSQSSPGVPGRTLTPHQTVESVQ